MRLALIIVALAGIAAGVVHLRRQETAVQHEIRRLELQRVRLRRELWRRKVDLARKMTPEAVERRARRMALDLVGGEDPVATAE